MEAAVHYLAIASSGRDADDCAAEEVQAAEEVRWSFKTRLSRYFVRHPSGTRPPFFGFRLSRQGTRTRILAFVRAPAKRTWLGRPVIPN